MTNIDDHASNTIRVLAAEMVQKANSGHPGAPMGLAPVAHALYTKVMKYNPANPKWDNRDRFVLSNGHACALQYVLLHLSGYDVSMDDLKAFRQIDSKCPGHPESFKTPGVEVSTGPLGQGIANAVGFAIAQTHLAAVYNKPNFPIVDNYTYVVCGDGCLQEGVASEAISLAGTMRLGRLIVLYDDNSIQIDGKTDLAFTEDVAMRFESMGWHVLRVTDGDKDHEAIKAAIDQGKAETSKPTIIITRTTIGFAAAKAGTEAVHGAPLGAADIKSVKTKFNLNPEESFAVSESVREVYKDLPAIGAKAEAEWNDLLSKYAEQYPAEHAEYTRRMKGDLPANWTSLLPSWTSKDKADATRNTSGLVLNALAPQLTELMGGSADLTPSNKTWLNCSRNYSPADQAGRYLRFGVREHAMAAIGNGLSAYGGFIPFTATFLNFIEYAFGAVRLSALSSHRQLYIMTHDSIGLGEDGPTHQPVEALNLLRATPNLLTFRPADANEVAGSYAAAIQFNGPSVLALSRQNLPNLEISAASKVFLGAYPVFNVKTAGDEKSAPLVILGTGSEVEVAIAAANEIAKDESKSKLFSSVTVVSVPCRELFDQQSVAYRREVIPLGALVVSVEAAAIDGWEKYAHHSVGMTSFGESAPSELLYDHFGFTGPKVAATVAKFATEYKSTLESVGITSFPPVVTQFAAPTTPIEFSNKL